jgi:hypothetical protein
MGGSGSLKSDKKQNPASAIRSLAGFPVSFSRIPGYFLTLGGTIASFADFATRNFTTFFAAILIVSPVAGFLR